LISIIGSGKTGSEIAFLAASTSLDDVVIVNRTKIKAIGVELNVSNAIPDGSSTSVVGTDDFSKIKNSKVVIISARFSPRPFTPFTNEPRHSQLILSDQVKMIKAIAKKIQTYASDATILMVSNPLDVLTYVFQKENNLPRKNVIGVGSSVDSNRFRYLLAKELETNQSEIKNAFVLGEHGDSMVPIFSLAKQNDIPILKLLDKNQVQKLTNDLRSYWRTLREFKTRSVYGVVKNTFDIAKSIVNNEEINIPASVLIDGEFGIYDVCMGVPLRINKDGIIVIQEINLSKSELSGLYKSADIIKKFLKSR